jgi:anti-sigma regulatory factor (Ser/Thr protein kinase)
MAAFAGTEQTSVTAIGEVLSGELLDAHAAADDVCLLALAFGSSDPFELHMAADAGRLKSLRSELRNWLETRGLQGADVDAVVLACAETAANAIEHGYHDGAGDISVLADTAPGEITIEVGDKGAWRAPGSHGRGRGLKIVEHLMDEVVFDRARGTRVTMRRRLRGG